MRWYLKGLSSFKESLTNRNQRPFLQLQEETSLLRSLNFIPQNPKQWLRQVNHLVKLSDLHQLHRMLQLP